jgi:hypothetical protein
MGTVSASSGDGCPSDPTLNKVSVPSILILSSSLLLHVTIGPSTSRLPTDMPHQAGPASVTYYACVTFESWVFSCFSSVSVEKNSDGTFNAKLSLYTGCGKLTSFLYGYIHIKKDVSLPHPVYIPSALTKTLNSAYRLYLCVPYGSVRYGLYLYVPYGSHSKQRLFPQTALTGWAL